MSAVLQNQSEGSGSSLLDSLYDTANSAVDLWGKWQDQKTDNLIRKTEIPSQVIQDARAPGSGLDQKTVLMIAGGVVAVGLLLYLARK